MSGEVVEEAKENGFSETICNLEMQRRRSQSLGYLRFPFLS
uniref:Uncharacterized protein n=1 Tax=Nelumbo nucifera TaxID=4432 RepID=A0A822XH96_NELNU|nr:TPA_asm: hypothetical protein HUJ06_019839 [Nelumbo nucifera]